MTWTAPEIDRPYVYAALGERDSLEAWLRFHRDTLAFKCGGLTAAQLKVASVEPSTLTLLGLVRHMAEVERWWFRTRFAGADLATLYCSDDDPDGDFDRVADADAEADMATFRGEADAVDTAMAGRDLDEEFVTPGGRAMNLRWVYMHVIEEYARHNGHADLIRERVDGRVGD